MSSFKLSPRLESNQHYKLRKGSSYPPRRFSYRRFCRRADCERRLRGADSDAGFELKIFVPSVGIEPTSDPSQGFVLSIER